MTDVRKLLSDALVQAAFEDDRSQKVTVSMRVLEILSGASQHDVVRAAAPNSYSPRELKVARSIKGWTQAELAARAGTSQQTVDRLERGLVRHSAALSSIAAALGISQ